MTAGFSKKKHGSVRSTCRRYFCGCELLSLLESRADFKSALDYGNAEKKRCRVSVKNRNDGRFCQKKHGSVRSTCRRFFCLLRNESLRFI